MGTAVWEPAWLGGGEDGKSSPEVLTQPTHQGFLCHNSLGSSGRDEVKKLEKQAAQGSRTATTLLAQEKYSKEATEDKPPGGDPMPCASWPPKVLYTAATELLMDPAVAKVGFDL